MDLNILIYWIMSSQESNNSKVLYVFLENGWGNMLLELLAAYSLADFMLPEKCKIIGLLTSAMMKTHQTVYNSDHQRFGLPHPLSISEILPRLKFEDEYKSEKYEIVNLNNSHPDWVFNWKATEVIMKADWMNVNLELILPRLSNLQKSLDNFRPSPIISEYLSNRYSSAVAKDGIVGLHLRVRQPGDIMARVKFPTAGWYVEALKRFDGEPVRELFVISGISTGHPEAQQYLDELQQAMRIYFPSLKIHIVHDEPYYIDFFLLAHMTNLIITNSSFSFMAAIFGTRWGLTKRVLMPTQMKEMNSDIFKLSGFEEVPGDDFVYCFRDVGK